MAHVVVGVAEYSWWQIGQVDNVNEAFEKSTNL